MSTTKYETPLRSKFIELCKQRKALMYGEFVLNCGVTSNIFFNSGNLTDAESFGVLCELLADLLIDSGLEFDSIVGLPYKGIPLASGVCTKYFEKTGRNVTFGYHRKEVKDHGEGSLLVGAPGTFDKGAKIVVLDDVLTTGKALNKALDLFQSVDVKIVAFVVIVNREVNYGGVNQRLSAHGICVKELFRLDQLDPNYKPDSFNK